MSNLTNAGENLFVDFMRGQSMALPANLSLGLLSAATDATFTENAWSGYARVAVPRTLANWAGTQGGGTIIASAGNSHQTSNNNEISFGNVAAGGSGTINFVGLFNGTTLIAYAPLVNPIVMAPGDPVAFPPGSIVFTLGLTGGLSDYASNKLIDMVWRGVAWTWPATSQLRLMTTPPNNSGGGTEVPGTGGYAPRPLSATLAFWAGTQGAGTTVVSTGTTGLTSNNAQIVFSPPTANWGTVTHIAISDGLGGAANLLFWGPMIAGRTIIGGGPAPRYNAAALTITFA